VISGERFLLLCLSRVKSLLFGLLLSYTLAFLIQTAINNQLPFHPIPLGHELLHGSRVIYLEHEKHGFSRPSISVKTRPVAPFAIRNANANSNPNTSKNISLIHRKYPRFWNDAGVSGNHETIPRLFQNIFVLPQAPRRVLFQ